MHVCCHIGQNDLSEFVGQVFPAQPILHIGKERIYKDLGVVNLQVVPMVHGNIHIRDERERTVTRPGQDVHGHAQVVDASARIRLLNDDPRIVELFDMAVQGHYSHTTHGITAYGYLAGKRDACRLEIFGTCKVHVVGHLAGVICKQKRVLRITAHPVTYEVRDDYRIAKIAQRPFKSEHHFGPGSRFVNLGRGEKEEQSFGFPALRSHDQARCQDLIAPGIRCFISNSRAVDNARSVKQRHQIEYVVICPDILDGIYGHQ